MSGAVYTAVLFLSYATIFLFLLRAWMNAAWYQTYRYTGDVSEGVPGGHGERPGI